MKIYIQNIRFEKFYCWSSQFTHRAYIRLLHITYLWSLVGWLFGDFHACNCFRRQLTCWIIKGLSLLWNGRMQATRWDLKIQIMDISAALQSASQYHQTYYTCRNGGDDAERMCWKWQNTNTTNRFTAEERAHAAQKVQTHRSYQTRGWCCQETQKNSQGCSVYHFFPRFQNYMHISVVGMLWN